MFSAEEQRFFLDLERNEDTDGVNTKDFIKQPKENYEALQLSYTLLAAGIPISNRHDS